MIEKIRIGRKNAMKRPDNPAEDRRLRDEIEKAQKEGTIIINIGTGYFIPDLTDPVDKMMFTRYIASKKSRIKEMAKTIAAMNKTAKEELCR